MLFILFQLDADRYALPAREVAEVLPFARLKRLPHAPAAVAGVLDFHAQPVPVIDLSALLIGRPARPRVGTRVVLARYATPDGEHLLGLLAEGATEVVNRAEADFVPSGLRPDGTPCLGGVAPDARGMIQWINISAVLPAELRGRLFAEAEAVA